VAQGGCVSTGTVCCRPPCMFACLPPPVPCSPTPPRPPPLAAQVIVDALELLFHVLRWAWVPGVALKASQGSALWAFTPTILSALRSHVGSPDVVSGAFFVLTNLVVKVPEPEGLVSLVAPVLAALAKLTHPGDADLAATGLGVLVNIASLLTLAAPGRVSALEVAVPGVVAAVTAHLGSPEVASHAVLVLSTLLPDTLGSPVQPAHFPLRRGPPDVRALVAALTSRPEADDALAHGLQVLARLCLQYPEVRQEVVRAGMLPIVLAALPKWAGARDPTATLAALTLLRSTSRKDGQVTVNLRSSWPAPLPPGAVPEFFSGAAGAAVVTALRTFPEEEGIVHAGLALLCNLLAQVHVASPATLAMGPDVVACAVAALRTFPKAVLVVNHAVRALSCAPLVSTALKPAVDALPVATTAVERHRELQPVVEQWLMLLVNLTACLGGPKPLGAFTSIPAVLEALTHLPLIVGPHGKDRALAGHLLRLFGEFNAHLSSMSRSKLVVVVPQVATALRLLKGEVAPTLGPMSMHASALSTLARIVESCENPEPVLAVAGTVAEVMTARMGDASVVMAGLVFLAVLAGRVPARDQGRVVAQTPVVRMALARHSGDSLVQEWVNKFLFRTKQVHWRTHHGVRGVHSHGAHERAV
jgi:hypothetical protein